MKEMNPDMFKAMNDNFKKMLEHEGFDTRNIDSENMENFLGKLLQGGYQIKQEKQEGTNGMIYILKKNGKVLSTFAIKREGTKVNVSKVKFY
ncbi:hypothetical protein [Clostridium sp. 'White wine YQ']|uniref:hypothetical protein n=1 Tax=Clostridium sp. 'White wine YQ' TaxID=3027474 RepID=UPI0023671E9D|nr:hypothetical protein [Clostridium sp. 'White wine YQ']MDD7794494.1 hypothetical protein [Clostridium sp. 'White wine YQ']